LTDLISAGALTPEGKNWLIEATDPFHDEQIILSGFPDMNVAASTVQCIKSTQSIKKSASITDNGNWDCNICLWPAPNQLPGLTQVSTNGSTPSNSNHLLEVFSEETSDMVPFPIGGVTAFSVPTGEPTYGGGAPGGGYSTDDCTLSLPTKYLDGSCRIIGMGLEVINTTAPLYKQGEVIVYRQPTPEPQQKYTAWYYQVAQSEIKDKLLAELRKNPEYRADYKRFLEEANGLHDRSLKHNEPGYMRKTTRSHR